MISGTLVKAIVNYQMMQKREPRFDILATKRFRLIGLLFLAYVPHILKGM